MSRWGYVVSSVKNKLTGGKAAYSARVQHMDILRGKALYTEMAASMAMNPVLVESLVNALGCFIECKLLEGYRLDFGAFKVGLTLRGGFDSKNDSFDPSRNAVCVSMTPSVRLAESVAKLRPENVTETIDPKIKSVCMVDGSLPQSVVACRKPCGMNGSFPGAVFNGDGDGVWLETADGERVASARIIAATSTRIDFQIESDVAPGAYKLYVGLHSRDDVGVASDSVGVTVVAQRDGALDMRGRNMI